MSTELTNHWKINAILYVFAGVFSILDSITIEGFFDWTFKILSMISIIMIIIINYPKVLKALKEIRESIKKNC